MPQPKPKAGGKGIHKSIGGFPVWVWGAGFLLAIGVGLYLRNKSKTGTSAATAQPTTDTGLAGTTSGTGGTSTTDPNLTGAPNYYPDAGLMQAGQNLQDTIDAFAKQINDSGSLLGSNNTPVVYGADSPSTNAANTTPTHPHTATAAGSKQKGIAGLVKGKPNTSAGRGHKPKAVAPKTHLPVTHHATHVAPTRHTPAPAPKAKPKKAPPKPKVKAKAISKRGS